MTWIIKLACWWDTCAYGRGEYKTYIGKVDGLDGMDIWDGRVETWDAMGKANQFHTMSDAYLACGASPPLYWQIPGRLQSAGLCDISGYLYFCNILELFARSITANKNTMATLFAMPSLSHCKPHPNKILRNL